MHPIYLNSSLLASLSGLGMRFHEASTWSLSLLLLGLNQILDHVLAGRRSHELLMDGMVDVLALSVFYLGIVKEMFLADKAERRGRLRLVLV